MAKFVTSCNATVQLTTFLVQNHNFSLIPLGHVLKIVPEKEAKGRLDVPLPQEAPYLLVRGR